MPNQMQPAITFLNATGDVTITWDEQNKEAVLALIEAKMKEGFSFFILKPRLFGLLGTKQVEAQSVTELQAAGSVVIRDADVALLARLGDPDVENLVSQGQAHLARATNVVDLDTVRRAKSAEDVAANQAVAVRRVTGG